jgi:hypothetical protein
MGRIAVAAALFWALGAVPASAQDDPDLKLIPGAAQRSSDSAPDTPISSADQRIYVENALTQSLHRDTPVRLPSPGAFNWQDRLFLDVRKGWNIGDDLKVFYSGRLNLRAEDDLSTPSHEEVVNDLREAYFSWKPLDQIYFDVGRINVKSGVALGYNPTDYFKTRAVAEPLSADPTALREDRLGTFMARAQFVWSGGSVTGLLAPRLYDPSPIYTNTNLPSFNPMLDRTNAQDRGLIKVSLDVADNVNPEFLVYREGSQTRVGTNLTMAIGQRVVAYLEWSGGNQAGLLNRALAYGRDTGAIPINAPDVIPNNSRQSFQNKLSVGASYTTESEVTINLEYHYNQTGFSRRQWDQWFAQGQVAGQLSPVATALWYIRGYAVDQQEQFSQHSVFVRADWNDAFIRKLELTSFVNLDSYDGSGLFQFAANYPVSDLWSISGVTYINFGGRHSDFGSLPTAASFLLTVARFF